jgi:hypothetical protein
MDLEFEELEMLTEAGLTGGGGGSCATNPMLTAEPMGTLLGL